MNEYYGMRKKRNIDLSRFHGEENTNLYSNISLPKEETAELEEGYEYEEVEEYEKRDEEDQKEETFDAFSIDGIPFIPKQKPKKESFMDTHVRYTTYLQKNLIQIIRMLQENGQIESITKFINDSVKDHLLNHYHNDN